MDDGKNWWVAYFQDPEDKNLNFIIENYSSNKNFTYEINVDDVKILEEIVNIKKGDKKELEINSKIANDPKERITIRVSDGNESREIYKNF